MKPIMKREGNAVYSVDQDCLFVKDRKKSLYLEEERKKSLLEQSGDEGRKLWERSMAAVKKWEEDKQKLHRQGIYGRDVCVAVLDTGIYHHPDLAGRIRAFWDYRKGECVCTDENGHGTQEAGPLPFSGLCVMIE